MEKTKGIAEALKQTKIERVREEPEFPDLPITLHFYRGDELVAAVQCPLDRDTALKAGMVAAMGFNADTMSIAFESYHSTLENSPLTGKRWMPKEMQYVAETMPDKDWVTECLTITTHERDGGFTLFSQPYRIRDGEVEWTEEERIQLSSGDDDAEAHGVMFEALQHAMQTPKINMLMEEQVKKDPTAALVSSLISDEETRYFHSDMATLRALEERELIISCLFAAKEGSKRKELLQERFGDGDNQM